MPYGELSRGRVYYQEAGSGRPIVLLHGNPGTYRFWQHQVPHLSDRYRVLALDMLGYGRSDKPVGADYSVFALADDVCELLDQLGVERTVLGGLSMGSMTSLAFALRHQDRLVGLILAGTTSDRRDRDPVQDLRELEELGFEPYLRRLVRGWYAPNSDPELVEWTVQETLTTERHVREATVRALASFHVTERLGEIQVPTLVIAGELDRPGSLDRATTVASGVLNGELCVVPGAAHMTLTERPREVNEAIDRFLARIGH